MFNHLIYLKHLLITMKSHLRKSIREKPHRLPKEYYVGQTVAFTLCTSPRIPVFNSMHLFTTLEQQLIESVQHHNCELAIYLFMPDHLHSVVTSETATSDPLSAMKRFKQCSGFWSKQSKAPFQWQKDFYDHILRREADLTKHIRYILSNPVRAGIVSAWKAYPYKGSTLYKIEEWDESW